MKLFSILVFASTMIACPLSSADTILPTNSNIRYVGRFNFSNPLAPRMYWSGTHIIAWFEGTSCQIKLNSDRGDDYYNIIVDNGVPVKVGLTAGLQTITAASGLPDGVHKLEIFKRTTYQRDNSAFEGLITDPGKGLALLPPEPALKIQFYGDSITDGHSVDSLTDRTTTEATYWNNYLTYAALAARNLNMQYVCTAASGIAVLYPWSAGFIMDNYYDRINPYVSSTGSNKWDFSNDDTDIVVINLFQNDLSVNPSPHTTAEVNAILDAYENLLLKFRAAHPNAEIICVLGNMWGPTLPGSVWPGYVDTVVARMYNDHGDSKVHSLLFPFKGTSGHPSAAEHVPMADALTAFIQANLAYLFTRDSDSDGFTDVQEANLATDPDDPDSYFTLDMEAAGSETNTLHLTWPSCTGVKYRFWQSSTLTNWTLLRDWTEAETPPVDSWELSASQSGSFFRVEAEVP